VEKAAHGASEPVVDVGNIQADDEGEKRLEEEEFDEDIPNMDGVDNMD
jgi:hypothetical protein